MSSVVRQIADLETLSAGELDARWRSLFGGDPPVGPRRFLVKRLAYRLQELTYGGLPEAARTRMEEIAREAGLDEQASLPGRRPPGSQAPTRVAGGRHAVGAGVGGPPPRSHRHGYRL